ncbi:cysteine desulfurase family protein [Halobacteroides halobius DSM 5150]|uniref:Cysteine desulfurase family protein n=1 Tax=Halobacteroides halobius (strain ATCC 35273 / DSM 5150 / MD-1) TaxID=748449 RepID=L0K9Q5_HALHC|nr:aminotransferase class V-fold PLP-dependent enzyme [Halobacteroides halobius]AGB42037.1 cysteine desulfurase family protein [Halobacteroides halobius DSM 5150]
MIYFDNAATTYPKPESVYNEMDKFYREYGVNAGRGSYQVANEASRLIDETREKVASVLNVKQNKEIVFTESATIAINLILKGLDWNKGDVVYYSPFEHNAVLRSLYYLKDKYNLKLRQIPVEEDSLEFKLDKLKQMFIKETPRLVAVSHVSNVCGLIAPVEQIAKLAREYNSSVLVDGAQGAGLVDVNLEHVDYYVWTGHKTFYGPFGIAGIIMDENAEEPATLIHGGTGRASERKNMPQQIPVKYEAGSSNIQAIAGLNTALEWLQEKDIETIFKHEKELTQELIAMLNEFMEIDIFIPDNLENHFNVVSVSVSGYSPHNIGKILDEKFNIAVRTGLHCAPETHEFLGTMPNGLVRFSIGYFNDKNNINNLKDALNDFLI